MSAPMIATMAELPRNDQLAEQFELLGDLMELEGADLFRINAYRKAAARIRETPSSVAQLALDGKAKALQGIGKTIEAKIVEVVEDGEIHALTKRKTEVPAEVATFMRLPGLGPKTARRIWQELGITTVDGLKAAAEAQELRGHAGIGPGTEQKIAEALARPRAAEGPHRALLGTTLPKLRAVVQVLQEHEASVEVSLAGSARRMRETVRDLDIIATATDPQALVDYFCSLSWVVDVAAKGSTKATVVSHDGLRFDLRVVPPESYGNLLQHFTGSKHHNVALREDAVRRGYSISEYSVTVVETGEEHRFATEAEVYALSRLRLDPAGAAGERRRARGRAEARAACARRAERPARRPAHAHDLVGREGLAGGHGGRGDRAGLRVLRDLRSLTAPAGRVAAPAGRADRRAERGGGAVPDPEGDRGQRPPRRHARRFGGGARDPRLGRRLRAFALRARFDRAGARRDGEPATSTASAISRTGRSASGRRRPSTSSG